MIKPWMRLILIQLLTLACSLGFAVNEYDQPMIFSGTGVAYGNCKILRIHSLTQKDGKVYTQSGVGWLITADEGYRLLTPSHVVSGADMILGECFGKFYPLQLQSRTETLDLALLRPLTDISSIASSPMIFLKKRSDFIKAANAAQKAVIESMHPDHFKMSLENKIKSQIGNSYQVPGTSAEEPLLTVKSFDGDMGKVGIAHFEDSLDSLVAETLAIQPGYSGAPLFAHFEKENFNDNDFLINTLTGGDYTSLYLMGMLTKTEINGSRSLGVSLPMILKTLPLLLTTQNPNVDVYAKAKGLPWRLQYKNQIAGKTLERIRELIYDSAGAVKIFTEVCEDDTLESSEWKAPSSLKTPAKSKDLKLDITNKIQMDELIKAIKIQGQDLRSVETKSSGGDYGEGGGSALSLKNSHLMIHDRSKYIGGYNLASYKRDKACDKVIIKDTQGNSYDSIRLQGSLKKATSLTDAYDSLSHGGQWTSAANGTLCKPTKLLNSMIGGFAETNYEAAGKYYFHTRAEGVAVPSATKTEYTAIGNLACGPGKIDIQLEQEDLKMNVHLGDVKNPTGFVQLRNSSCMVALTSKNYSIANPWKHQIRSPLMDMDITLGTEGRILSIKVLKAATSCLKNSNENLWLLETHFNDPETMDRMYIQFKAAVHKKMGL